MAVKSKQKITDSEFRCVVKIALCFFSVCFYFYNSGKPLQDFLRIKRLPYCLATVAETNVSANSETLRAFKLKIKTHAIKSCGEL